MTKAANPSFTAFTRGILTPDEFSSNRYYRPTEIPKGPDDRSHILFYGVSGEGGRIEGENAQQLSYGMASSAVRAVPAEGYRFLRWSDGVGSAAREGDTTASDRALYALFIADTVEDHGVPILCVEVANGEQISDTYTWKECSVTGPGRCKRRAFLRRKPARQPPCGDGATVPGSNPPGKSPTRSNSIKNQPFRHRRRGGEGLGPSAPGEGIFLPAHLHGVPHGAAAFRH